MSFAISGQLQLSYDWPKDKRKEYEAAVEKLKENSRDFMRWIYKQLELAYDDQNADEQVDEDIRCNEYLFTESGKRSVTLC